MAIAADAEGLPVSRSTSKSLQIAAAVIGNALERYDFVIFGFLTVVISRLFFPSDSQYASLLLTTATFGDLGAEVLSGSSADFAKLIAADTEKWVKVIRAANIKF